MVVKGPAYRQGIHLERRVDDRGSDAEVLGKPGVGAEHSIGADGVRLARRSQASRLANDRVGLVEGNLERQHADHVIPIEEGRGDEAGGIVERGEIAAVLAVGDATGPSHAHRIVKGLGEIRRGEWARLERGAEIDFLEDGVNDRAGVGIDQEDVIDAIFLENRTEDRMHLLVVPRVGGAVEGVVEQLLRADGLRAPTDVKILQRHSTRIECGGIEPHVDFLGCPFTQAGGEFGRVVAGEVLAVLFRRWRELLPSIAECHEGFQAERVGRRDEQFLPEGFEVPFDGTGGRGAHCLESREGLLPERVGCRAIHRDPQERQGQKRHCQQCRQHQASQGTVVEELHVRNPS